MPHNITHVFVLQIDENVFFEADNKTVQLNIITICLNSPLGCGVGALLRLQK